MYRWQIMGRREDMAVSEPGWICVSLLPSLFSLPVNTLLVVCEEGFYSRKAEQGGGRVGNPGIAGAGREIPWHKPIAGLLLQPVLLFHSLGLLLSLLSGKLPLLVLHEGSECCHFLLQSRISFRLGKYCRLDFLDRG